MEVHVKALLTKNVKKKKRENKKKKEELVKV